MPSYPCQLPVPSICLVAAPKWVATLNIGCGGAHASYYHKANEQVSYACPCPGVLGSPALMSHPCFPLQVQVGVEFEANTRLQDTTFAFGYQLNLTQANVIFRGESPGAPAFWRVPALLHIPSSHLRAVGVCLSLSNASHAIGSGIA